MSARIKKACCLLLLVFSLALLSGCRVRTTGSPSHPASAEQAEGMGQEAGEEKAASDQENGISLNEAAAAAGEGGPEGPTQENPDAQRKEYDENAAAEIIAGTERMIHTVGEGEGLGASSPEGEKTVPQVNPQAEETATQTVPAEEAEQKGVSEAGKTADSAFTYYSVLLQERAASLYECRRLNVYWEGTGDHETIHKTFPEHQMILDAGVYDVSSRLLPENLRVDDGWVQRKNPDAVIKVVPGHILGGGVHGAAMAEGAYAALLRRPGWEGIGAVKSGRVLLLSQEMLDSPHLLLAARLLVAKTAYPDLYADVDMAQALAMLMEEATGSPPAGVYYYPER